jgi:hypothetical protein
MPSFKASPASLCTAALLMAVVATGCASSRLSTQMPPGVRLAGDWRLDPARSDHLGQALAQLREQSKPQRREVARRRMARMTGQDHGNGGGDGDGDDQGPPGGGRRHGRAGNQTGAEAATPGEGPAGGPGPHISPADELMASVPPGEYLRITTGAASFTVTTGDSSNQYTPGLESDISAQQGDAQQISGWKDSDYVIDTKPQWGPEIIQRYGLTKDGRLSMTVRLTGGRTRFLFTRIYDRTTSVSPLAPPTNN